MSRCKSISNNTIVLLLVCNYLYCCRNRCRDNLSANFDDEYPDLSNAPKELNVQLRQVKIGEQIVQLFKPFIINCFASKKLLEQAIVLLDKGGEANIPLDKYLINVLKKTIRKRVGDIVDTVIDPDKALTKPRQKKSAKKKDGHGNLIEEDVVEEGEEAEAAEEEEGDGEGHGEGDGDSIAEHSPFGDNGQLEASGKDQPHDNSLQGEN